MLLASNANQLFDISNVSSKKPSSGLGKRDYSVFSLIVHFPYSPVSLIVHPDLLNPFPVMHVLPFSMLDL